MYGRPELSCSPLPEYHGAFNCSSLRLFHAPEVKSNALSCMNSCSDALNKGFINKTEGHSGNTGDFFFLTA